MKTPSAVVIGAGIGGIATSAHLARHGYKVKVLEKNRRPGGRCDRFTQEGHQFDTGPTLLIMPLVYEKEFAALGVSLHDVLELQRVDPTYRLIFDDGSQLQLTSDLERMCEQLERVEPGSFRGFLRYLEEGRQHYQLAMARLVERNFRTPSDFFTFENLPLLYQIKPLTRHYQNMSRYFTNPRLKAAFTFQDVYMGLSPFEAPATFSMMPYTELAHGVWYPKGGMYRVVEALTKIALDSGVEFVFDAPAQRIEVDETRARAVILEDGRRFEADVIVANADLPYVYQSLLPEDRFAQQLAGKQYSCSVISFFWGVDQPYPGLGAHNLFLADDFRENFDSINQPEALPQNPSLYVHVPTRLDASLAPPREETVIAVVPVGHLGDEGGRCWHSLRDQARQAVFRRLGMLGITDLEAHIKFEVNYTPLSWSKRYNLVKGATHGLAHTLTQLGYLRPHNRHARYQNLYFAGASTHPGTGVPTALISARLVAERIRDEQ